MKQLTLRQQTICLALPKVDILADVGCDHGYVGAYALTNALARQVLFCDISEPSLNKARVLCQKLQLLDRAQFYCMDGLQDVRCDCAVIAGMGGLEIISVLSKAKHLPAKLVLQPMRNQKEVRQWLVNNGYGIVSDKMFYDGKFYDLITADVNSGERSLTIEQLTFGLNNVSCYNADFLWYADKEIKKCKQILSRCAIPALMEYTDMLVATTQRLKEEHNAARIIGIPKD